MSNELETRVTKLESSIAKIESSIAKIESSIQTLQRELATPLLSLRAGQSSIGAGLMSKLQMLFDTTADLAETMQELEAGAARDTAAAEAEKLHPSELRASIANYAEGQPIPASTLRDVSIQWRKVTAMLRKPSTQAAGMSHLRAAGISVTTKGKFIYFTKGPAP